MHYTVNCKSCRRNLEYYDMCHNEKVRLCDSDCTANSGELTVKIPKDTYSTPGMGETLVITSYKLELKPWYLMYTENKPLKIVIEFSLEKPQGGVQFVLPPDGATAEAMVSHLVPLAPRAHRAVHMYVVHSSITPC